MRNQRRLKIYPFIFGLKLDLSKADRVIHVMSDKVRRGWIP
jgi:hypothetical protein